MNWDELVEQLYTLSVVGRWAGGIEYEPTSQLYSLDVDGALATDCFMTQ